MNRESETYFRDLPEVHIPRSKIEKPHDLKTTWNVGGIYPVYVDDILPGTTVTMKMAAVMRMQTPLYPTMQNLYTDFLWFFVPYRLIWDHFKGFWGESPNSWYPTTEYEVPQISIPSAGTGFDAKSLADYMGIPTGVANISVNALAFRSYCKIFNDWFKSDALDQDVPFPTDDNDYNYTSTHKETARGGTILVANKLHDAFTSSLPYSQAGPDVQIPLGTIAPVYPTSNLTTPATGTVSSLKWSPLATSNTFTSGYHYAINGIAASDGTNLSSTEGIKGSSHSVSDGVSIFPSNLWADLSQASAATVNLLRSSIAIQQFYEQRSRYGTKYIEFLRGIFGVISPDARLQRSEYLGGRRVPMQIGTVLQTSSTDTTSPQGNTGAYSHTVDSGEYFTKSFTEHGVLMCLMVTRYKHVYEQGIPAMFQRKKWTQWYIPQFNGLGEQPIPMKTIYATGTNTDTETFGFQEYGWDYRYMPDQVTSEMRSSYSQSLNAWHYGDYYNSKPVLGATWLKEDKSNVDRTLVVSSGLADQLFGDFYFNPTYVLPMPIYSIPGLQKL